LMTQHKSAHGLQLSGWSAQPRLQNRQTQTHKEQHIDNRVVSAWSVQPWSPTAINQSITRVCQLHNHKRNKRTQESGHMSQWMVGAASDANCNNTGTQRMMRTFHATRCGAGSTTMHACSAGAGSVH
jgi:hypothetical protein